MERFIKYFVTEFENKLVQYSSELSGEMEKAGKYAELAQMGGGSVIGALGGAIASATGLPSQTGVAVGRKTGELIVEEIANLIGKGQHMEKVTNLSDLVSFVNGYGDLDEDATEKAVANFRKMLVEAGVDIFQSFEAQFMMIKSEKDLRYLGLDAAHRVINYLSDKKEEFDKTLIAKGVIFGDSKDNFRSFTGVVKRGRPIIYGFEAEYKRGDKSGTWDTSKLYSKAGIAIPSGEKDSGYYRRKIENKVIDSNKDEVEEVEVDGRFSREESVEELEADGWFSRGKSVGNTDQYGYRRLLTSENWDEMKREYEDDVITKKDKQEFVNYEYILDPLEIVEISENVLKKINFDDKRLTEKRIMQRLGDSEKSVLDAIEILRSEMNNFKTIITEQHSETNDLKTIIVKQHEEFKELQKNTTQEIKQRLSKITNSLEEITSKFNKH